MHRLPLNASEIEEIRRIQCALERGETEHAVGLGRSSKAEEFDRAFLDFVHKWHPDRFFSRDLGEHRMVIHENFALVTRWFHSQRHVSPGLFPGTSLLPRGGIGGGMVPQRGGGTLPERSSWSPAPGLRNERDGRKPPLSEPPVAVERGARAVSHETTFRRPGTPPPRSARSSRAPAAVDAIRRQIGADLDRARQCHAAGKADFDGGRYVAAEANLYLASRFDPGNAEYLSLHKEAVMRVRQARAAVLVAEAERAESYGQRTEAVARYKKAIDLDPPSGTAWFGLAQIMRQQADDIRAAVQLYRTALTKEPRNVEYAITLAEVYDGLGLKENALKLALLATATDRNHGSARALLKRLRG